MTTTEHRRLVHPHTSSKDVYNGRRRISRRELGKFSKLPGQACSAFVLLEPYDAKASSPVPRGLRAGNRPWLLGGRYIKRPPLSQSRLKHYDGKTVAFDYLDHKTGKHRTAQYDNEEFIRRFVQHIPDKHFRMINFYGFLANRVRGKLLPKIYALLNQIVEAAKTIRWADLQKQTFGLDPLLCILCGSPMRFAGVTLGKSINELRQHHEALALAKIVA